MERLDRLGDRRRRRCRYDPTTDSWRVMPPVEIEAAKQLREGLEGFPDPETIPALAGILRGTVKAVVGGDDTTPSWVLVGERGGEVVLPPIVDRLPFIDDAAAWTGSELIVWGGMYICPITASCVYGPTTPFILRPPAGTTGAEPQPAAPADTAGVTWVLFGIEVDGVRTEDDEPGVISLDFSWTIEPIPLPVTFAGWAGCDYEAVALWGLSGALDWSGPPSA